MDPDVVNLRLYRKRKVRSAAAEAASENRIRFGRTAAERKATALERQRADVALAGHQREPASDTLQSSSSGEPSDIEA